MIFIIGISGSRENYVNCSDKYLWNLIIDYGFKDNKLDKWL